MNIKNYLLVLIVASFSFTSCSDDFLNDPNNLEKILNYQYFARVKILSGETQENYIPDSFR